MTKAMGIAALLAAAGAASADVFITEWMYNGTAEFVELYVTASTDFSTFSYDDDSRTPGVFSLAGAGLVDAGTFVIFTQNSAAAFIADWSLGTAVANGDVIVLGGVTNNLGRNDEINIFDGATLVDRLTYGDQTFPGTIRTENVSGNTTPAFWGANDVSQWFFSTTTDGVSYLSANGELGNPGQLIPTPATAALLGLGGLVATRRRR